MAGNNLSRILDLILKAGGALSGVIIVAIMAMVCIKVFLRYVVGYGWIGVDQLSGTMILYSTFLGAAWVLNREEHVTIDILISHLSPRAHRLVFVTNSVLCALVCLLVFVYGVNEVIYSISRGFLVAAELEIPRAVNLIVIPIGCLFLWIQFSRRAWLAICSSPPVKSEELGAE
jgi:C4-dicarboxylate transporter, DctQ subunit